MRSFLLALPALLALFACTSHTEGSASASADLSDTKVLLDCNVFESGGGPDQQVQVDKRASGLVLRVLTTGGSWIERPLSDEEWKSGDLKLHNDDSDGPDAVNRLYRRNGAWINEAKSDGWHEIGFADCSTMGEAR
jgi:hypothetical protein